MSDTNGYRIALTLDNLIGDDSNWMVSYVYNNWGNSILMLLPRLDPDHDSEESKINNACMSIGEGTFEEEYAVDQWIKEYPHTPFLVSVGDGRGEITKCVEVMKEKIAGYNNDWQKFIDDSIEFDKWRRVVYYVSNTDGAEQIVCHEGWKALLKEAGCEHESNRTHTTLSIGAPDVMLPLMKELHKGYIDKDFVVRFDDYLKFRITRPELREKYNYITTDCGFDAFLREALAMPVYFAIIDGKIIPKFNVGMLSFNLSDVVKSIIEGFVKVEEGRNN